MDSSGASPAFELIPDRTTGNHPHSDTRAKAAQTDGWLHHGGGHAGLQAPVTATDPARDGKTVGQ